MNVLDFIQKGGTIMYILLALNVIGVSIIIFKILLFKREKDSLDQTAITLKNNLPASIVDKKNDVAAIVELCKQELSSYILSLEGGLSTIKIIASISPLLGLLGTVIGVLISFQIMAQSGQNDPASFAGGISMALITTVGGLIVAIPHYVAYSYFISDIDKIESKLEKKILSQVL